MNKIICALFATYQLSLGQPIIPNNPNNPNQIELPDPAVVGQPASAPPLECNQPCTTTANCPSPCAQGVFNYVPSNYWTAELTQPGAGAASTFNINFPCGVTHMDSLKITAMYAAYGATFNFNNNCIAPGLANKANAAAEPAEPVVVTEIVCGPGNCAHTKFVFGPGVDYGDLKCDESIQCGVGCTVSFYDHGALFETPCELVSTT